MARLCVESIADHGFGTGSRGSRELSHRIEDSATENGTPRIGCLTPSQVPVGYINKRTFRGAIGPGRLRTIRGGPMGPRTHLVSQADNHMFEFEVLASILVIGGVYFGLFFAAEKLLMK